MARDPAASTAVEGMSHLVDDLVAGRGERAQALFAEAALAAPVVVWSPIEADIRHPMAQGFAELCRNAADAEGALTVSAYEGLDVRPYADWLADLRHAPESGDYIYHTLGQNIAAYVGDLTGQAVADPGDRNAIFRAALHEAVVRRGEMALSLHDPHLDRFAQLWTRVIVPLVNEAGAIHRIISLAVLENAYRAGLDILPDPAILATRSGQIRFANIAAQSVFGTRVFEREPATVSAYCGFDIDLDDPRYAGDALAIPGATAAAVIGAAAIVHFEVRISPFFMEDEPMRLLLARPVEKV